MHFCTCPHHWRTYIHTGSGFPAGNNTSPAPFIKAQAKQQQQPFAAPTGGTRGGFPAKPSKKTGAPTGGGGGGGGKVAKTAYGASPNSVVTRNCDFCKALNMRTQANTKSISYTLHDADWCVRNPNSPKYDAAKAAVLPTK